MASVAPIINEVKRFADEGKPVLGVCNGFQILTEIGLLPGALLHNDSHLFVSRNESLKLLITKHHSLIYTKKMKMLFIQ